MSFYTALTGLNGSQSDISATSNNIANVGTTGFKRSRAEFGDIFATSPLQNASIKVEAYANSGKGMKSVGASVYSEVLAASTGDASSGVVYDVRGYGDVKASDVVRFKSNDFNRSETRSNLSDFFANRD